MDKKSRILILSTAYLPHIGGSELAIKNITDRINDFEFHLVTARLDRKSPEYEIVGNVSVFRVGGFFSLAKGLLPKNLLPLAIFFKANSLIEKNDYKLIHAFQVSEAAGAGWLLKFFYPELPLIVTMQEGKDLDSQGFLINFFRKLIIKKTNSAIAISQYLKNYILKIKKDMPVTLIPNGVDLNNFSKEFSYGELANLEDRLGIQPDDKVIVSVSRLVDKNGLDLLIEAFHKLTSNQQSSVGYKLLLIGEGSLEKSLKAQVKNLNLENKIIFVGPVQHEVLPAYLKISDVFVRPSRSEGLGSAFLEAMAAGVPVIATNVGGISDFLKDPSTGSGLATGLFCSLEPDDIASKVNVMLDNETLRREIIKNSNILVEGKYNWDKIAEQYKEIFNFQSPI